MNYNLDKEYFEIEWNDYSLTLNLINNIHTTAYVREISLYNGVNAA